MLRDSGIIILLARSKHLYLEGDNILDDDGRSCFFNHLDRAIERAEDILLESLCQGEDVPFSSEIDQTLGFLGLLQPQHRQTLASLMQHRLFHKGDHVIRKGDPGQELFLVSHGRFTTAINLENADGSQHESRLATFGPGMCFGEIAFLSGQTRTANVTADQDGSCWVLLRKDFDHLRESDPTAATELMLALTRDLGQKLAITSYQLTLMEHY
jgi:CRP-like cAMP-binding protein